MTADRRENRLLAVGFGPAHPNLQDRVPPRLRSRSRARADNRTETSWKHAQRTHPRGLCSRLLHNPAGGRRQGLPGESDQPSHLVSTASWLLEPGRLEMTSTRRPRSSLPPCRPVPTDGRSPFVIPAALQVLALACPPQSPTSIALRTRPVRADRQHRAGPPVTRTVIEHVRLTSRINRRPRHTLRVDRAPGHRRRGVRWRQ